MSSYYQTSAKPRGRRETGASDSSTRSRAPSESLNLAKKTSRSSDENSSAKNNYARPDSPATFLQRHKTLDRSSVSENIIPRSSSSASLKSIPNMSSVIQSSSAAAAASTPTSPLLTTSRLESKSETRSLKSKSSSKSMTDAASSQALPAPRRSLEKPNMNLQPSVTEASEETTPIPTPFNESTQPPLSATNKPPEHHASRSHHSQDKTSPKQPENVPPQPTHQPQPNWYLDPNSQQWAATGSPSHSPAIHQYGGFQTPQYPYDYSQGYNPHMMPPGYQYGNPYYPMQFSPPAEVGPPQPAPPERQKSRSGSEEQHSDLMNRIQTVLPDLSRLLDQYREGQAPPTPEGDPVRQFQIEQTEKLTGLQQELDATKKEYEKVIRKLVDENCTLKSEVEDRQRRSRSVEGDSRSSRKLKSEFEALQAQHQNLANSVDSIRLSKEELIAEKLGVEKHIESLRKDKHYIKDSHHRVLAELKAQHLDELATRDNEHAKAVAEHKAVLSKVQLDLATLITKHSNSKKDLEIARSSEAVYRASADARSKELDAAKTHHSQQVEKLKADHQRVLESLKQEHKSQRQRFDGEKKKFVTELEEFRGKEKDWESKSQALQAELQEHKDSLEAERQAHSSLKAIHEERTKQTADLAESMVAWRAKHAELQKANESVAVLLGVLGFGSSAEETIPEPAQAESQEETSAPQEEAAPAPTAEEPAPATEQAAKSVEEPAKPASQASIKPEPPAAEATAASDAPKEAEPTKTTEIPLPPEPAPPAAEVAPEPAAAPTPEAAPVPTPTEPSPKPADVPLPPETPMPTPKVSKESLKPAAEPAKAKREGSRPPKEPTKIAKPAPTSAPQGSITFRPINYYQVPGQFQ